MFLIVKCWLFIVKELGPITILGVNAVVFLANTRDKHPKYGSIWTNTVVSGPIKGYFEVVKYVNVKKNILIKYFF